MKPLLKQKLKVMKKPAPPLTAVEVERQVERILASRAFRGAGEKLPDALGFVVQKKLANAERDITQKLIAKEVFECKDFDPMIDNVVRLQMRKLRQRLDGSALNRDSNERVLEDLVVAADLAELVADRGHGRNVDAASFREHDALNVSPLTLDLVDSLCLLRLVHLNL